MYVKWYKIKHIAIGPEELRHKWRITVEIMPTWFGKLLFDKQPITRTLVGNCMSWEWLDTKKSANYMWRAWAHARLVEHVKEDDPDAESYIGRPKDWRHYPGNRNEKT